MHPRARTQWQTIISSLWRRLTSGQIPTYDKELNLVYLPTGNGPPDYWGGDRNQVKEKFGTAVVAVDTSTGKAKWVYQIVHHDVWDYDLPSQPVLYDIKNAQGERLRS